MASPDDRVDELAERVREEWESFEPPDDPDEADDCAKRLCREGVGPTILVYVEGRAGDELVAFGEETFDRLEGTLNEWLALYARCYGVDADPDVTVREAAEVFVDTHSAMHTAQILTGVPERS
ncbi:MAG: hypothetical protein ACI9YT_002214 [Halobacteriales archaeon]|jgi:hypothetical protein